MLSVSKHGANKPSREFSQVIPIFNNIGMSTAGDR